MDQISSVPTPAGDPAGLPERAQRRAVSFPARLALGGETVLDVFVHDLSYDGCQIEVPLPLAAGESVQLAVQGRGVIHATVRWCKDRRAGLRFADEAPAKRQIKRQGGRRSANIEAQLRRIGRLNYSVELRDLSRDGCMIDLVERPVVGEVMHVKLPGLETMEARVRWVDNFIAGLKFEHPMHPAVYELLLQRIGR